MNTQPIEILEEIISHIPTHLLYNKCLIDKTWFILVSRELHHRRKEIKSKYYHYEYLLKEIEREYNEAKLMFDFNKIWECEDKSEEYNDKYSELITEIIEIDNKMLFYGMLTKKELYEEMIAELELD